MKFIIEQKKLKDILDYLQVDGIFPFVPLTVKSKNGVKYVESIQETSDHGIFRYAKFTDDYFKTLTLDENAEKKGDTRFETINFEAEKVHKLISREAPETDLTIYTENERLYIDSKRVHITLNLIDSSLGQLASYPFKLEKGVPFFRKGTVPLNNYVTMSSKSFKNIVDYAGPIGTIFFSFRLNKHEKFTVKVGDLEGYSETVEYTPNAKTIGFESEVDVVLTQAVKQVANTIGGNVGVRLKTGFPVWFFESSQKHKFGVLVAPHRGGE